MSDTVEFWRLAHPLAVDEAGTPFGPYQVAGQPSQRLIRSWGEMADDALDDLDTLCESHADDLEHPSSLRDGLVRHSEDADGRYSGCASREQLLGWFAGWLRVLDMMGFRVYLYEVPRDRVRFSLRQGLAYLEGLEPTEVLSIPLGEPVSV